MVAVAKASGPMWGRRWSWSHWFPRTLTPGTPGMLGLIRSMGNSNRCPSTCFGRSVLRNRAVPAYRCQGKSGTGWQGPLLCAVGWRRSPRVAGTVVTLLEASPWQGRRGYGGRLVIERVEGTGEEPAVLSLPVLLDYCGRLLTGAGGVRGGPSRTVDQTSEERPQSWRSRVASGARSSTDAVGGYRTRRRRWSGFSPASRRRCRSGGRTRCPNAGWRVRGSARTSADGVLGRSFGDGR